MKSFKLLIIFLSILLLNSYGKSEGSNIQNNLRITIVNYTESPYTLKIEENNKSVLFEGTVPIIEERPAIHDMIKLNKLPSKLTILLNKKEIKFEPKKDTVEIVIDPFRGSKDYYEVDHNVGWR